MSENFRCPRQAIAGWSTMHSQNGNSRKRGGSERHCIPLAKMLGGCIPLSPLPLTPLQTVIDHYRDNILITEKYKWFNCVIFLEEDEDLCSSDTCFGGSLGKPRHCCSVGGIDALACCCHQQTRPLRPTTSDKCHNLRDRAWSGGVLLITPGRLQRWQHAVKPYIGSESRFLPTTSAIRRPR